MKEQILVFDESEMQWLQDLEGFSDSLDHVDRFGDHIMNHTYFADRDKAETDTSKKQIIPYTLVINKKTGNILAYKRTKKSGEGRLHDKWSVGVGGHVNLCDIKPENQPIYVNTMRRELEEEVGIVNQDGTLFGLLYDPSNSVGKVHFGVVMAVLIDETDIKSTEDAIDEDIKWVTETEALNLPNLENWSKIVIEAMINEE